MNTFERKRELVNRICAALLKNYDEYIGELETPAYSLLIEDNLFELPEQTRGLDLPEGCFVDELYCYEDEIEEGDVLLHLAQRLEDDYTEVVDFININDLDVEYLERLAVYAENHKRLA